MKHEITRADVIPMRDYARDRREHRRRNSEIKKTRRMEVGPYATFYFESYATMWHQVHEMLYIESGGEDQIQGELDTYNPLIPNGRELVATLMFEIENPDRRTRELARLGGVEGTLVLRLDGEAVAGVAEEDVDRTNADGKASSVQFVHFPLGDAQIAKFRAPETRLTLEITHPNYAHMAVMPPEIRAALTEDLD